MKTAKFFGKSVFFILFICFSLTSSAQIKTIGDFFAGGVDDAGKLFEAYMTPWANALGTSLSGGWYNTAKPHKLGGFDITFTANMTFVPDEDKTFDLAELGLSPNSVVTPGNSIAPTVAGEKTSGPPLTYRITANGTSYPIGEINTPQGTGVGLMAAPMGQIGLGLIKGTDVMIRLLPRMELGKYGSLNLWGIGGKHSLKQWIPAIKKIPFLYLSVMGGYTQFNSSFNLSVGPDDLGTVIDNTNTVSFANQTMDMTIKSLTFNALVSANLPVICFYGGLGIVNTKTELALSGYYPVPTVVTPADGPEVNDNSAVENPFDLEIENNDGKPTKPRINVGFRLKLGVITIHGDYTYANYSNVTAGLGLSVR
jgi:hypothetical protein